MGFGSIWHWLIVLAIVILIFGTKKLRNVGKDLGEAVGEFKKGVSTDEKPGQIEDKSIKDGSPTETETSASKDNDRSAQ